MKPLLSVPVKRGKTVAEWEPSEHHLTDEGRDAFRDRQRQRMAEAEAARADTSAKVRTIKRGKA
jgi:hypothetical protein